MTIAGFLFVLQSIPVLAQERANLHFRQIAAEQVLPQVYVLSILQDRRGFMWFGTNNGLDRYDGYTFKILKLIQRIPPALAGILLNQ